MKQELPFNEEAERSILGSILQDSAEVMPICERYRLEADSFYVPEHRAIFATMVNMREELRPIDLSTVPDFLRKGKAGTFDNIDENKFLTNLVDCTPTVAHAEYYIQEVLKAASKRRVLAQMEDFSRELRDGTNPVEVFTKIVDMVTDERGRLAREDLHPRFRLSDLMHYIPDLSDHLAGEGWLRRGAGTLLVGGTGLGKTVLAQQLAVCVASGLPFFGIRISEPHCVLFVQAESDQETLKRDFLGIVKHLPGKACPVIIEAHLSIHHVYGLSGSDFAGWLADAVRRECPDLIVVDPFQAYIGGGELNSSETFLTWIEPVDQLIKFNRCALLLVAHTPKPRDRDSWTARESVYMAAGSSVISNWCRTSCELTECGNHDGRFRLRFSKNAERAGMVDDQGRIVRDLYLEHSGNRYEPYWRLSDDQGEPSASKYENRIIELASDHPSMTYQEIADELRCSKGTVAKYYPRSTT